MYNEEKVESLVRELLVTFGEDPNRDGLVETPKRVALAFREILKGYSGQITLKTFDSPYTGIVARVGIPFHSTCEHHLMIYSGVAHFGYIPANNKVVGVSKIIRFIQHKAAKLTIQENLTEEIVEDFYVQVQPEGCMVILSATHHCEACRGVKVAGIPLVTQSLRGTFLDDPSVKNEFLHIVERELKR